MNKNTGTFYRHVRLRGFLCTRYINTNSTLGLVTVTLASHYSRIIYIMINDLFHEFHVMNQTTLPVNALAKLLRKIGHDVMRSDDADRFVCNYVYYHSLRFAEEHGIKSLFVHVPLFSTIDEAVQMHFVASLLEAVASLN